LIYASAEPEIVSRIQSRLGKNRSGELIENTQAEVARRLLFAGMTNLVVAGSETSGAVVQALGLKSLRIGLEIEPRVPWTFTVNAKIRCLKRIGLCNPVNGYERGAANAPGDREVKSRKVKERKHYAKEH
jgi:uncharacterized protein YgbK (DUF1537 family)